ncbi:MAG: hypothetical protein ACJ76Y_24885 [Thermoanaerobaculia bacterium]
MKNALAFGSVLAVLCLSTPHAEAQVKDQEISVPFENRITPSERQASFLFQARITGTPNYTLFVSPLLIKTDGAWLDQIAGGVILKTSNGTDPHPLSLAGSFTHIDPDGSADLKKYGLTAKYRVYQQSDKPGDKQGEGFFLILGKCSDGSQGVAQHLEAGVYGEWPIVGSLAASGRSLVVSGAAKVARSRKPGQEKSGGILNPGLILKFSKSKSSLSVDYTLDNNVDGEDDYSIGYEYDPTSALALIIGAGKHHTFSFNLVATF